MVDEYRAEDVVGDYRAEDVVGNHHAEDVVGDYHAEDVVIGGSHVVGDGCHEDVVAAGYEGDFPTLVDYCEGSHWRTETEICQYM